MGLGNEAEVMILMATYNGEHFLRKQLDSIINQTYQNWLLKIRDDGSNDSTIDILNEYAHRDSRIEITINTTQVHGWQQNFQVLMQETNGIAMYYMFCDQDDIWKFNKIETFLKKMKLLENELEIPIVVYGDMEIIDAENKITNSSFQSIYNMKLRRNTDSFFSQRVYGCNMMFNQILMKNVLQILGKNVYKNLSHDGLVVKVCAIFNGTIYYLEEPYMQYRRYLQNATSSQEFSINKSRVMKAVANFKKGALNQASTYRQSIKVLNMSLENCAFGNSKKSELTMLRNAIDKGGLKSVPVWIRYKVNCGNFIRTVSHLLVLISNAWKE